MGYGDMIQGARQSVNAYADRKARKREGSMDRLHNTLSRLGAQKYGTEERKAGQEFATSERTEAETAAEAARVSARDWESNERTLAAQRAAMESKLDRDHERAMLIKNNDFNREFEVLRGQWEIKIGQAATVEDLIILSATYAEELKMLRERHLNAEDEAMWDRNMRMGIITREAAIRAQEGAGAEYEQRKSIANNSVWRLTFVTDEYGQQQSVWEKRENVTFDSVIEQFNRSVDGMSAVDDATKTSMKETYYDWLTMSWDEPPDEVMSSHDVTNIDVTSNMDAPAGDTYFTTPPGMESSELVFPEADLPTEGVVGLGGNLPPGSATTEFFGGEPVTVAQPAEPMWLFEGGVPMLNPRYTGESIDYPEGVEAQEQPLWAIAQTLQKLNSMDSRDATAVTNIMKELEGRGAEDTVRLSEIESFLSTLKHLIEPAAELKDPLTRTGVAQ